MNPWQKNQNPLWILAPMEDVTDTVFRQLISECGRPDILYTEFTSTDGLSHDKGRSKVIHRLEFSETERPIIAQIWGKDPEHYYKVAQDIAARGFDGVDINMGCPVKKIIKQGCCSALIKNPSLASEIIIAVQEGVKHAVPVSVKTRIGFDSIVTEEWSKHLLKHNLAALIIHGRTTRELSKVPCHWEEIAKVPKLRDRISPKTLIIGNGDIFSRQQGLDAISKYGVDGIMVGRGIFKNPWFFNPQYSNDNLGNIFQGQTPITKEERIKLCIKHIRLWDKTWQESRGYNILKKYFKIYIQGFNGASAMRSKLMETKSASEAVTILKTTIKDNN